MENILENIPNIIDRMDDILWQGQQERSLINFERNIM